MINHQASRLNLLDDYKTGVRNPRRLLPRARARVVRVFQDIPRGDHSDQFRFRFAGFGQKDSGDPTRAAVETHVEQVADVGGEGLSDRKSVV